MRKFFAALALAMTGVGGFGCLGSVISMMLHKSQDAMTIFACIFLVGVAAIAACGIVATLEK